MSKLLSRLGGMLRKKHATPVEPVSDQAARLRQRLGNSNQKSKIGSGVPAPKVPSRGVAPIPAGAGAGIGGGTAVAIKEEPKPPKVGKVGGNGSKPDPILTSRFGSENGNGTGTSTTNGHDTAEKDSAGSSTPRHGWTVGDDAPINGTDSAQEITRSNDGAGANRSYEQVLGLIDRIGSHLELQAERSERVIKLLERIPEALEALPAIRANSEALLQAMASHLKVQEQRDERLQVVLGDISANSSRQTDVLGMIEQRMDASQKSEAELASTLTDFRQTLMDMGETNSKSIQVLSELTKLNQRRQDDILGLMKRQNKMMFVLLVGSMLMSASGLVIAIVAIMKIASGG